MPFKLQSISRAFLFVGLLFLLTACGAVSEPTPTVDPNLIYTQAAETVQANLTGTAAAMPTSTNTPEPTATWTLEPTQELPTATATLAANGTLPAVSTTLTTSTVAATKAATTGQQAGDHGRWVQNVPADGTTVGKGENFMLVFRIQNTGTTTWSTDYRLVHLSGTGLSSTTSINLDKATAPGDVGEFYITVFSPLEAGKYKSNWKLVTPHGAFITEVYFAFTVS
jgi:hypothetical protein